MTRLLVLLALGLLLVGSGSRAQASDPIVIRFSHVVSEMAPKGVGALRFKQLAEARLPGRVQVEVYPSSRKFTDEEVVPALLFGDVQLAAPSMVVLRGYAPALQVYELPFLFNDVAHIHRFQKGPTGQMLLHSMLPRGVRGLGYWDGGMRVLSSNKPLRTPADATGLMFRTESSQIFQRAYDHIGVVTLPLPFRHLSDAIRDGLIDGQENSWPNIYTRGIHKLHRYYTPLHHTFLGYMVITSDEFWKRLPADVRPVLDDVLAKVTREVNELAGQEAETLAQKAASETEIEVLALNNNEKARWHEAFTHVWRTFEPVIGTDVIEAAVAAGTAPR
ncbi:MAG: DctP family TRAP transporter solute-binding subunit [Defluviicoccus sp.]